jgi:hypothetical protein
MLLISNLPAIPAGQGGAAAAALTRCYPTCAVRYLFYLHTMEQRCCSSYDPI